MWNLEIKGFWGFDCWPKRAQNSELVEWGSKVCMYNDVVAFVVYHLKHCTTTHEVPKALITAPLFSIAVGGRSVLLFPFSSPLRFYVVQPHRATTPHLTAAPWSSPPQPEVDPCVRAIFCAVWSSHDLRIGGMLLNPCCKILIRLDHPDPILAQTKP